MHNYTVTHLAPPFAAMCKLSITSPAYTTRARVHTLTCKSTPTLPPAHTHTFTCCRLEHQGQVAQLCGQCQPPGDAGRVLP